MSIKKHLLLLALAALVALPMFAQMQSAARFSVSQKRVSPTEIEVVFSGTIDNGWHVYSTNLPEGGPTEATFQFDSKKGIEAAGPLKAEGKEISAHDPIFNMNLRFFEHAVRFVQRLKITAKEYEAKGYLEYGACNDQNCLPPTDVEVSVKGSDGPENATPAAAAQNAAETATVAGQMAASPLVGEGDSAFSAFADTASVSAAAAAFTPQDSLSWWKPVVGQLNAYGGSKSIESQPLWMIFLLGLLGGLLALFTPCVWPVIPMTVSFFMKRAANKSRGVRDAVGYGVSIIVIFVAVGLIVTAIFGGDALNSLSTNAVVNVLFFLLLVLFGASFLGGFDLSLPDKWTNGVNNKSESTTGLLSIFLMAFTLVLVSFSCTAPIVGLLLVDVSTSGNILGPTIGMLGFAIALALPFTLFALFPSLVKKAPKSGSWMNTLKVTLGFIELAFSLKFLSVADLAYGWHLLDRETFLALWIVLFALLGMYLLGRLKFPHDDDGQRTSVVRFFMGWVSLAFAVYMVPGLWGAPCKAVSAFAPPLSTQDFKLDRHEVRARFTDYEQGMAYARRVGKPVMIDFTGFGCVNCRKMEMAVWNDKQVAQRLTDDYVLISLYVDDKTRLPQSVGVTENGQRRTLRTVGNKWSYLQSHKFGANAQPFYVLIDNDGNPLAGSYGYNEDIDGYLKFLDTGLKAYSLRRGR